MKHLFTAGFIIAGIALGFVIGLEYDKLNRRETDFTTNQKRIMFERGHYTKVPIKFIDYVDSSVDYFTIKYREEQNVIFVKPINDSLIYITHE